MQKRNKLLLMNTKCRISLTWQMNQVLDEEKYLFNNTEKCRLAGQVKRVCAHICIHTHAHTH